jgi:hypothetical protein
MEGVVFFFCHGTLLSYHRNYNSVFNYYLTLVWEKLFALEKSKLLRSSITKV